MKFVPTHRSFQHCLEGDGKLENISKKYYAKRNKKKSICVASGHPSALFRCAANHPLIVSTILLCLRASTQYRPVFSGVN
ncbi:hypothetical protein E2C01_023248 [Portunus trituberculatus]|uniref:Uncharacterized protein n=1 Tax=Portunus trituberculatus TaxID=210409 RepID=A0A5B7EB32_PORTR|nr:hypothetical protein [Portunus trituberculatus]